MLRFLFPLVCAMCWCWRGYSIPKIIHGYLRGFITSFIIIGYYCLCISGMSIFSGQGLYAIIVLTLVEGLLGYGSTTEQIDIMYYNKEVNFLKIQDEAKEPLNYLGFVSMSYYLFPYLILQPDKSIWVYILIAVLGFRVFPMAKLMQLKYLNNIAKKYNLDSWKIVESLIGIGFGVWLMGS